MTAHPQTWHAPPVEARLSALTCDGFSQPELLCTTGPSAIYEYPSSLGKQTTSTKKTLPSYSIAKDEKMKASKALGP